MNIFEALRHDHDKQRSLVDALIKTSGDSQNRQSLMNELKHELEEHAKFEERFFYNPLMCDDLTQEKARHSVAEHHDIDELIIEKEGIGKINSLLKALHLLLLCFQKYCEL